MENLSFWNPTGYTQEESETLAKAEAILRSRMNEGQALTEPDIAGRLLRMRLAAYEREVFTGIFLDTRHRVIEIVDLFAGSIDCSEVHPRVVAQAALRLGACALIVGHNHPSGNNEPSAADRAVTARLKAALQLIDVRLLDHFVVSTSGATSLAARGWI